MGSARCADLRPSWAAPTSRSRRRCSDSKAPVSSCWSIRARRGAGGRASPATSPSSWRRASGRSSHGISTRPVPRRSRRARCSRTTRRFLFCWAASIWRKARHQRPPKSCGARCVSIRCSPPPTASSDLRSSRWAASARRSRAGTNGNGWRAARRKRRSDRPWTVRATPRGCSVMDDIRALSAQLAQDPQSLVFLRLGEALRRKGQLDAALRVAVNGLERHPHLADAHDLYARILTDKHEYERAFEEWDMAVRIAPHHTGALKGLAFLYFKVGNIEQAEAHLAAAKRVEPDAPTIDQAVEMIRGGPKAPASPAAAPAPPPESAPPAQTSSLDESRVFAGLEGANEGLLLIDGAGRDRKSTRLNSSHGSISYA